MFIFFDGGAGNQTQDLMYARQMTVVLLARSRTNFCPTDVGTDPVICFGHWDVSGHDDSRGFKYTLGFWLALLYFCIVGNIP